MSSARALNGNPSGGSAAASRVTSSLDGDVKAVERLEHAAIPMRVEAGIEQPELGLEVLMHGRGLALQAPPQ